MLSVGIVAPILVAASSLWNIDPGHTHVGFSVKHMMVSNVRGEFSGVKGTIMLDDDVTKSKVDVTVDMATVDTREPKRDDHLKSPDFFDVAKFPTMTFKSKSLKAAGADKLTMTGDLTMHGVTKEVTFEVSGFGNEIKDPWGNTRRGATATAQINRKDFGLTWNKAMDKGGVVVGEAVTIQLEVELLKDTGKKS